MAGAEQSRPLLFMKQYSYTYQLIINLRDEFLSWSRQTNPPPKSLALLDVSFEMAMVASN